MAAPKTVAVFGATGSQGGAVVRSLLDNQSKSFAVRAITRDPESKKSKDLAALGAEVVCADGWNVAEMTSVLEGCWAAFVNTNSDDPIFVNNETPTEFDLGKSIIDSLVAANVRHVVYSSFASSVELTKGKLFIKPMELKNQILQYAKSTAHFDSVCPIYAAWYYEQFLDKPTAPLFGGFPYTLDSDGYMTFNAPRWGDDEKPSFVSITRDFGDLVHGILLSPESWNGKPVAAASDVQTFEQLVETFQTATGHPSRYIPMESWEEFGRGIPELDEHRLLFAFTQLTGGRYFGDVPTSTDTAAALKSLAAEARGKTGAEARLLPLGKWFAEKFGVEAGGSACVDGGH